VTREGFAQLINYQKDLTVCGQAGTAPRAIVGIDIAKPDLVIVDICLADANGLDLIKDIKNRYPALPILALSMHDEALYAERALRAGARGYVMKQAPTSEVMHALRTVLRGELYLSETMRTQMVRKHLHGASFAPAPEIDALTDRELEIFQLIGAGYTTRRMAARLHLSVSTVETHRARIKLKLKVNDRMQLVRRAVEWDNRQHR
jgi:DNA-binding NarL/FixJ family response regulator